MISNFSQTYYFINVSHKDFKLYERNNNVYCHEINIFFECTFLFS